jgi:uncharacterized protein YndB with AHSA1/START domain
MPEASPGQDREMPEAATRREIRITRIFDAPRDLVWKAWTEPDRLAQWWGKRGWSTPVSTITMDVRPGGVFRLTSVADDDGREMHTDAVYREVVEPERLVFAEAPRGDSDVGALAIVTLTDLGDDRTEMDFRSTIHASDDLRRRAAAGLDSAFGRLAEHLAQARAST